MRDKRIRSVKPEIRIIGVDDGMFVPHTQGKCDVIGVVFRGGHWLEGVMRTQVEIDGVDATEKIANMIIESAHYKQLRVIMLDGVTFAGFNVVNTKHLSKFTELPIIAVTRDKPDFDEIRKALRNLSFSKERWQAMKNANKIFRVFTRPKEEAIFIQVVGIEVETAKRIVKSAATRSNVPEPLRVAHLIASGVTGSVLK